MVNLQLRERQIAQAGEGRIADSKIVDRDGDAAYAQLRGDLVGQCDVVNELILGYLDDQPRPRRGFRPVLRHQLRDRELEQHTGTLMAR